MNLPKPQHLHEHGMSAEQIREVQDKYGKGPFVTVDMVIVTARWWGKLPQAELSVLAVKRKNPPFRGWYALPGGFVELDEDLEQAARRELHEETGISLVRGVYLEQLRAFGLPQRDPRGRNISVAHLALVPWSKLPVPSAGDDASRAVWLTFRDGSVYEPQPDGRPYAREQRDRYGDMPPPLDEARRVDLAFDHDAILSVAAARLQHLTACSAAPLAMLPPQFSVTQLTTLYDRLGARARRGASGLRPKQLVDLGWIRQVASAPADTALLELNLDIRDGQWPEP